MKIVVIGSGPGGLAAALRAAELGAEVVIIEKDKLGGVCLNEGCIPTKKLLDFAGKFRENKELQRNPQFYWRETLCEKEKLIENSRKAILRQLKLNQIKTVKGEASFVESNTIEVKKANRDPQIIEANKIIVAAGSSPTRLPVFDYGQPGILTSNEALNLKEIPKSLIIVGGGVIGLEFATIFHSLGSKIKITIVEMAETLLPGEDLRIVEEITQILQSQGIEVLTQTKCREVSLYGSETQKVRLNNGRELQAEKILISVGRIPNTKNLKLKRAGVQTDRKGFIPVNEKMETYVEEIYAIGDIAGKFFLAPVAELEGKVAAENALGYSSKMDYSIIPRAIFTIPQIGVCGLNSNNADPKVKVGQVYFTANAEARIRGETEGFLQIVADETSDKILGAQIIGPQASHLIQEIAVAMKGGLTCQELARTCVVHPTLPEIIPKAAEKIERRQ